MNLLPAVALAALVASDDVCSARLDQLLTLHRAYELPFPPPDARLMRVDVPRGKYLDLRQWTPKDEADAKFHGFKFEEVKPEPGSLAGTEFADLDFAIHCHARGWKPLACAAFRKWLGKADQRAERQLACDAWSHWVGQVSETEVPLPVIAKHLKRLLPLTGLSDEKWVALLQSLDLALVPSKAPPGSDDALLDEFIERRQQYRVTEADAYKALARRGFDALPAVIAHLGDDRLTRFTGGDRDFLRVKDVAYILLCDFAGKELAATRDIAERTAAAGRWFADAQKLGEEEYVAANAGVRECPLWDDILLPLLVEKYPRRLPGAYRNFMAKQKSWAHLGAPLAKAIVESPIPQEEKLKVLEFAATHANPSHRLAGLRHLMMLDPKRAAELYLPALEKMPSRPGSPDVWLASLVGIGTDPEAWDALTRTAKRVDAGVRVGLLYEVFVHWDDPTPAHRRLQFAFVASHLTDTDVWDEANDRRQLRGLFAEPLSHCEVRNYAALRLLAVLGIHLEPEKNWTPARWASVRELTRVTLEHHDRR